jgi:hypothetical protein
MTEDEWLTSSDPEKILEFLRGKASDRKLRLLAVACCQTSGLCNPDRFLSALLTFAEAFADGQAMATQAPTRPHGEPYPHRLLQSALVHCEAWVSAWNTVSVVVFTSRCQWSPLLPPPPPYIAEVLFDVFGNPFRPVPIDSSWLTWRDGTVVKLAQGIYDDRAFDRLPILADALVVGWALLRSRPTIRDGMTYEEVERVLGKATCIVSGDPRPGPIPCNHLYPQGKDWSGGEIIWWVEYEKDAQGYLRVVRWKVRTETPEWLSEVQGLLGLQPQYLSVESGGRPLPEPGGR